MSYKLKLPLILAVSIILIFILFLNAAVRPIKLSPGHPQKDDEFGWAIASDGNNLVIGADQDNEMGYLAGAVYVYSRNENQWLEKQKILPGDARPTDYFGRSVAISGDTIVIGAFGADNGNGNSSGAVYIFKLVDGKWVEQQKITANDAKECRQFGASVAIDGDTIVVGAYGCQAAYIFVYKNNKWTQQAKLTVNNPSVHGSQSYFGGSVAIEKDIVVVGDTGNEISSVFTFTRHGNIWTEQSKLSVQNESGFGWAVAIEGNTIIVGSPGGGTYIGNSYIYAAGAVYVYVWDGNNWVEQARLTANDASEDAWLGRSVAISENMVAIGAPKDVSGTFGAVYVFVRDGNIWQEKTKLINGNNPRVEDALYKSTQYLYRVINGLDQFSLNSWKMSTLGGYRYPNVSIDGPAVTIADNIIAVGDYESYTGGMPAVFVYSLDKLLNINAP